AQKADGKHLCFSVLGNALGKCQFVVDNTDSNSVVFIQNELHQSLLKSPSINDTKNVAEF
ncbi:hypothetical protein, partial [Escherichia coli]|uniref:hypothetical protein n=1 Tax=Escherichia coli TaxID=562 RepID=UPI003CFA468D